MLTLLVPHFKQMRLNSLCTGKSHPVTVGTHKISKKQHGPDLRRYYRLSNSLLAKIKSDSTPESQCHVSCQLLLPTLVTFSETQLRLTLIIRVAPSENVSSSMRKIYRFGSSCACAKYHPGLCSQWIHSVVHVSNEAVSGQRRSRSDCAKMQADLGLHCPHFPEDTFSHGATHEAKCLLRFGTKFTVKSSQITRPFRF